ncbi:spermatogenesis associated 6-like protein [Chanos chanos]|uniref:Spermatogenesis associated 6-like protein n=1 Tax=Chanos chanos TaxID=29144 RepID=A0A6J2VTK3_CHACN|nr:spermatogenesis associated 6-like protein [Chanos chanos]
MAQKAMRVTVELHLRAVTCPGVHLPAKDDVYLFVCLMNQYRKSECLPAVFPLLFREKMRFEKVFKYAVDPADIAEILQFEMVKVELIQLIPPVGEILASFEEDARSFLFPEPKLVPSFSGVDREVLMTRDPTFPGISPRLEFSTRTTISDCSEEDHSPVAPVRVVTRKRQKKSRQQGRTSPQRRLCSSAPRSQRGYQGRETAPKVSRSRSLSPYTAGLLEEEGVLGGTWAVLTPKGSRYIQAHQGTKPHSASPKISEQSCSLLRSSNVWEEVQERVRNLLSSSGAVRRLAQGATDSETDEVLRRRSISPHSWPL